MIYLLLGKDDFSKREFISRLLQKEKLEFVSFGADLDGLGLAAAVEQAALNNNLFGGKKLVRVDGFFGSGTGDEQFLEKLKTSMNEIIFVEEKLDKRKAETKKVLASKHLKVLEFDVPVGAEFKKWVSERAKEYDLKLGGRALDLFLQRLGFEAAAAGSYSFSEPLYDLWQVDSELQKLKVFAGDQAVTEKDVLELVSENIDENIFKITNAIGDKNKALATKYLTDYMDRFAGVDEKTKVITLSGLLAEQFRNILIIQGGVDAGFASGKMFVYKKLASRFTREKVLEALKKLELLDQEVKTSSGPAALQFFMIIDSVLK